MRRLSLIWFLWLFCCGRGLAEERGSVSGFAIDAADGEGLIGASVYLEELLVGGTTNNSGYYVIPDIPAGEYELICAYIGYQNYSKRIEIRPGEDVKVRIDLEVEVLEGEETVVRADSMRTVEKLFRKTISQVDLSALEIKQIPQVAEADLLRSLQTLPGILPLSDFSSALYVRGGTPDQNLYMIDGTDVYNPEHAFGIFSTFNTDAVKQVELSKGGLERNTVGVSPRSSTSPIWTATGRSSKVRRRSACCRRRRPCRLPWGEGDPSPVRSAAPISIRRWGAGWIIFRITTSTTEISRPSSTWETTTS